MSKERQTRGLGMGLQALLGDAPRQTVGSEMDERAGLREIDVARIRPNPDQPRVLFDSAALEELAQSIAKRGVLQPILVRPDGDDYLIIAGERRWRAAQMAQLHRIPAIIRDSDAGMTAELALIENIQREDLNAIEEAEGYRQLIENFGHSKEEIGRIVHKSRSHVSNLLRLLDLPDFVRQSLLRGDISMGHARAAAGSPDPEGLTRNIIAKGWSVRQAEDRARECKPENTRRQSATSPNSDVGSDLAALERQLGDMLGLKVRVTHEGQSGDVTLHYSSLDQLDMICQRLSGEPI